MPSFLFNSSLVETLLSIVFIYALLSLVASSFAEIVNFYFKERGRMLYATISSMFEDKINVNFGQMLYEHPVIYNLRKDRSNLPQYIDAEVFAASIIDVIGNYSRNYKYSENTQRIELEYRNDHRSLFERCRETIMGMKHTDVKLLLMNMIDKCDFDPAEGNKASVALDLFKTQMKQWFNSQMDRTTGWYKTKTSVRLRWVAFFIALIFNIDSIRLFTGLYKSPIIRGQISAIAETASNNYRDLKKDTGLTDIMRAFKALNGPPSVEQILQQVKKRDTTATRSKQIDSILAQVKKIDTIGRKIDSANKVMDASVQNTNREVDSLADVSIPFGWKDSDPSQRNDIKGPLHWLGRFLMHLFGLLITTFAISNGAPFWFELLNKLVNLRKAGVKPATDKSA